MKRKKISKIRSCKDATLQYTRNCVPYNYPGNSTAAYGPRPLNVGKIGYCHKLRRKMIGKNGVCKGASGFDVTYLERKLTKNYPKIARRFAISHV